MNPGNIQNHLLEITVVECVKLKDTEWLTKQDPYVCLDYGGTKFRTRVCSGGDTAPVFQERFMFKLIQGLQEINVEVLNYHRFSGDNLIGSGKIQLQDVLARGYDDRCWPIYSKSGRFAGEVKLIMHYSPPNGGTTQTVFPPVAAYHPPPLVAHPPNTGYPSPPPATTYQPPPVAPPPYRSAVYPQIYPSPPQGYPTTTYPPPPGQHHGIYPPPPY